jgi:hypothetical protein
MNADAASRSLQETSALDSALQTASQLMNASTCWLDLHVSTVQRAST